MDIADIIQTFAVYALPVLFAITVHEAAHGYVARRCGDMTATLLGRVTLNPIKHIDPVGTILVPAILLAMPGNFLLGWAKPVPVRFDQLRHPKRDMVWVALAGPASNLLQALLWGVLLVVLVSAGVTEPFFIDMCKIGVQFNVILFVFNLLPLPPLDGGRILVGLLPRNAAIRVSRIEPWGIYILLALIVLERETGLLGNLWIGPLMSVTFTLLKTLLWPLRALLN